LCKYFHGAVRSTLTLDLVSQNILYFSFFIFSYARLPGDQEIKKNVAVIHAEKKIFSWLLVKMSVTNERNALKRGNVE
jgi:hypothetical protein